MLRKAVEEIEIKIDDFQANGSGWVLHHLLKVDLGCVVYDPLKASSYICLPKKIADKKACINIQNKEDDKCFLWSIIAFDHKQNEHAERVTHYLDYEEDYDMEDISYLVKLKDVNKFEKQNPDYSVNVFGYDDKKVFPLRIADSIKDKHVNLLLITNKDNHHYVLISDFSRLIRSQVTKRVSKEYFCYFCLHGFVKEETLKKHIPYCCGHGLQRIYLPKRNGTDDKVFFNSTKPMLRIPFVMYADFECLLQPSETVVHGGKKESWTSKEEEHVPSGFAVYTKCDDPRYYQEPFVYRGDDFAVKFIDHVLAEAAEIKKIYSRRMRANLTSEEQTEYDNADKCYLCNDEFITNSDHPDYKNRRKVLDHNHLDSTYRGACHSICNLNLAINPKTVQIPCIFHNLKGYDAHLILSAVKARHGKVTCIPTNTEKYITFTIGDVRFIDSQQFMPLALETLVANQKGTSPNMRENFPEVTKYLIDIHGEHLEDSHRQQRLFDHELLNV
ncbi:uncharacterized protein [Clytia hemisphaerica]|uniref:uncharacterized protein n=1 Tax=Clytia hemisphaerica TaxID=252671 RepID=UPI0034D4FA1C